MRFVMSRESRKTSSDSIIAVTQRREPANNDIRQLREDTTSDDRFLTSRYR